MSCKVNLMRSHEHDALSRGHRCRPMLSSSSDRSVATRTPASIVCPPAGQPTPSALASSSALQPPPTPAGPPSRPPAPSPPSGPPKRPQQQQQQQQQGRQRRQRRGPQRCCSLPSPLHAVAAEDFLRLPLRLPLLPCGASSSSQPRASPPPQRRPCPRPSGPHRLRPLSRRSWRLRRRLRRAR